MPADSIPRIERTSSCTRPVGLRDVPSVKVSTGFRSGLGRISLRAGALSAGDVFHGAKTTETRLGPRLPGCRILFHAELLLEVAALQVTEPRELMRNSHPGCK